LTDAIGKLAEVADRQLAILERTNSDSAIQQKHSLRPVDRPIPKVSSDPLQTAAAATIETSTAPLFSQLEDEYVDIRKNAGASDATISTIRLRVNAFKVLVGDRPIDAMHRKTCRTM
jgi:hypothetical protein